MGEQKEKSSARKRAAKNRYCAGAKLSEHKFLRILRGFAEGIPIQALEATTRVSGKTIRATYKALRANLVHAALEHPDRFGGAGHLLFHDHAHCLLYSMRHSPHFRRHRRHHAPRLSCAEEEQRFVTEAAVRLFCALDLREWPLHEDEEAKVKVLIRLTETLPRLRARDPLHRLAELIPQARPHAHPTLRLYEDYRRYLLKNPLASPSRRA